MTQTIWQLLTIVVLTGGLAVTSGCRLEQDHDGSSEPNATSSHSGHEEEHGAGHDHGHGEVGPNGGHVVELGDGQYHAEWLHDDDTGKVTVILSGEELQNEVAVPAEEIQIHVVVDEQLKSYTLTAANPTADDPPQASRFEIVDPSLLVALQVGEGVEASLSLTLDDQQFTGRIEHHEHDDHGHAH